MIDGHLSFIPFLPPPSLPFSFQLSCRRSSPSASPVRGTRSSLVGALPCAKALSSPTRQRAALRGPLARSGCMRWCRPALCLVCVSFPCKQRRAAAHALALTFSILLGVVKIRLCRCISLVQIIAQFPRGTSYPPPPRPPHFGDRRAPPAAWRSAHRRGDPPGSASLHAGGCAPCHSPDVATERPHASACPRGGRGRPRVGCPQGCWPSFSTATCAVTAEAVAVTARVS